MIALWRTIFILAVNSWPVSPILCSEHFHHDIRYSWDPVVEIQPPALENKRDRRSYGESKKATQKRFQILIVFLLDESRSLEMQKSDVIKNYNSFLEKQRGTTDVHERFILIKFNTVAKVAHKAMDLDDVPRLTVQTYRPYGSTALYDNVVNGIRIAEAVAMSDEKVRFFIFTDGDDNASKKTTSSQVKYMMKEKEALGNWTFLYFGAKPEEWGKNISQSENNLPRYNLQDKDEDLLQEKSSKSKPTFTKYVAPELVIESTKVTSGTKPSQVKTDGQFSRRKAIPDKTLGAQKVFVDSTFPQEYPQTSSPSRNSTKQTALQPGIGQPVHPDSPGRSFSGVHEQEYNQHVLPNKNFATQIIPPKENVHQQTPQQESNGTLKNDSNIHGHLDNISSTDSVSNFRQQMQTRHNVGDKQILNENHHPNTPSIIATDDQNMHDINKDVSENPPTNNNKQVSDEFLRHYPRQTILPTVSTIEEKKFPKENREQQTLEHETQGQRIYVANTPPKDYLKPPTVTLGDEQIYPGQTNIQQNTSPQEDRQRQTAQNESKPAFTNTSHEDHNENSTQHNIQRQYDIGPKTEILISTAKQTPLNASNNTKSLGYGYPTNYTTQNTSQNRITPISKTTIPPFRGLKQGGPLLLSNTTLGKTSPSLEDTPKKKHPNGKSITSSKNNFQQHSRAIKRFQKVAATEIPSRRKVQNYINSAYVTTRNKMISTKSRIQNHPHYKKVVSRLKMK